MAELTPEELVLILKYGAMRHAVDYWWGRVATTEEEEAEHQTLSNWQFKQFHNND